MKVSRYIEWDAFSTIAISGQSGSGKTSTVRFLIAQLLINNTAIYVCDPHGNAGNGSLRESILPIESFLAQPIAITLQERVNTFKQINTILKARLNGIDKSKDKIAIILDEATRHFIESSKEQVDELATILQSLANEGRKANIRCFLLSQNWKSDFIGSRSVRSSITHVIFHRTNGDEVKLFVPSMPAKELRMIASLPAGHTYVYPFLYKLRVPYISQDDIEDFAKRYKERSPFRYKPIVQHVHSVQDVEKKPVNVNNERLHDIVSRMIQSINNGDSKEATIRLVFNTYKSGRNPVWNAASKLYDKVKDM